MKWSRFLLFVLLSVMATYPIYRNFYYGRAITTYERHIALLEKRSEYFNPWQYRVLSPALVEAAMFVYDHTVDKVFPIEEKIKPSIEHTSKPTPETEEVLQVLQKPGALKYMVVFVVVRWLINVLLLALAYRFFLYFTPNRYLVLLSLLLVTWAMGNGVQASDLTFNTYLDNCFYLLAGILIVGRKNMRWMIPVTILAAFNRETSILIPALFFLSRLEIQKSPQSGSWKIEWPVRQVWIMTAGAYALFAAIFIGIRLYFGYQEPQVWKVPSGLPMLKLNLFSAVAAKNFFEIYGVVGILPVLAIAGWKRTSALLQRWFLVLVPVWFLVHLLAVVVYQSRLFLVPTVIVFIPMVLEIIESYSKNTRSGKYMIT